MSARCFAFAIPLSLATWAGIISAARWVLL